MEDDIQRALRDTFREEAKELLAGLEEALLELEGNPSNRNMIGQAFRALHTIKGNSAMFGFEKVEAFAHDLEALFDKLRSGEITVSKPLVDLTLVAKDLIGAMLAGGEEGEAAAAVADDLVVSIQNAGLAGGSGAPAPAGEPGDGDEDGEEKERLGEILVERGRVSREDLNEALEGQKKIGELQVENKLASAGDVESALDEQKTVKARRSDESASSIRVHSFKLDRLVDLVGELVVVQARLSRMESEIRDGELTAVAEEVERLTWELRDSAFSIRMVPIGTTFNKFRRLVRDLAREMGREVKLETEGGETELDKMVIEKLNDPIVHLIRNCIDHGIEPPEERQKAGKPSRGVLRMTASHAGADVVLEISDDGKGLDSEAIRRKAVDRGIVDERTELSADEILRLVFQPGFSTAKEVTSVSGRGVGMDVVKTSIDTLQGSVDLKSEAGQGTTFVIRLPLTLAIIEGLEVDIAGERFVIPLAHVEECIELVGRGKGDGGGRSLMSVRDELVPYIRLRETFTIAGEAPEIEQTVVVKSGGLRVGLVVDYVVGEHQTVIKSLGRVYRGLDGFSGATILGDGSVALLLDVPNLIRTVEREEDKRLEGLQGGG